MQSNQNLLQCAGAASLNMSDTEEATYEWVFNLFLQKEKTSYACTDRISLDKIFFLSVFFSQG